MKKLYYLAILAWLLPALLFADGGEQKLPDWKGPENGPKILVLNGGRPWCGRETVNHLKDSGAYVLGLIGTYMDGFSGAPIREQLSLSEEPKPFDGITPAFKNLPQFRLIVINQMPQKELNAMFTPERIAALRDYLANGGRLVCCQTIPANLGDDALPVKPVHNPRRFQKCIANRPELPAFSFYPQEIPVPNHYRVEVLPGAEILSALNDADQTPFLAKRNFGKGAVYFFNSDIHKDSDSSGLYDFAGWGYANAFYITMVNEAGNLTLQDKKHVDSLPPIPDRTPIESITVDLPLPDLGVTEISDSPEQLDPWTVQFGNGCKLTVKDKKTIEITYPGESTPLLTDMIAPKMQFATTSVGYNPVTAERDVSTETIRTARVRWRLTSLTVDGSDAVLTYTGKDARMEWRFRAGTMHLDGRIYQGVGDSLLVQKCPMQLGSVKFISSIRGKGAKVAHRLSCYLPPRGYSAFNMTGAKEVDTACWDFFGSGQPFELLTFNDGVYMGAVDAPFATSVSMHRDKGAPVIQNYRTMSYGRVNPPKATAIYWHWYSKGPERPHHDYLAMYQFQRQNLRRKAGLDEIPAVPIAYDKYISAADHQRMLELAKSKGYRFFKIANTESPIDSIIHPTQMAKYKQITDMGMSPYIWSAGSYTQGDTGWIYKTHPEWFVRDPQGKIFCYSGNHYPVIDVNNPEFFEWYKSVLTKAAKEGGVQGIYRDMDGTAATCVNYAVPESPHGLPSQIKFYRLLQDLGYLIAIEGQNPLVMDEYWYRSGLYSNNYVGNEYILVGSMPSAGADIQGGLQMDFFRLGMYDCFIAYNQGGILLGLDQIPGSLERGLRGLDLAGRFIQAIDAVGMPFIRETPFGTCWFGPKGGALFFWKPVKELTLNLPEGWSIKGVEGNTLTNVPCDSIFLLEKK